MQNETDGLLHYLFHNRNVLRTVDHRRLLELCRELEFPDPETPSHDPHYGIRGWRSTMRVEPEHGELYSLIHKAHLKIMPKIYGHYHPYLPTDCYDKYSGYYLCKYPEGGYLTKHVDLDGDAGSTTVSFNINDDYEGGELCFWDKHIVEKHANCMHVSPSNHLFMHEVKPITKGTRYSVIVWFSYHKGDQWLT